MLPANFRTEQRIALVDCNNFYASCERVFRPAWRDRPLGVLSNNDGCIIARSDELKQAGIPMGAPYFKIKRDLQRINAVVVSSNFALYGDMSRRVMFTLGQSVPEIEVYSIDEAWLNLTGIADPADAGHEIVAKVTQHTGIPVSMGLASTKVLAKIANRLCKSRNMPGGVYNFTDPVVIERELKRFPVAEIWGIGKNLAKRLYLQGIDTAWQLRECDPNLMRKRFNVMMQRMVLELRGISCLECEDIAPKKQIISSRSFGSRRTEKCDVLEAVSMHATRAAEKLRSQNSACGAMHVSIRSGRHNPREGFTYLSDTVVFPCATSDTRTLIRTAKDIVERHFIPGIRYAKAGVALYDIVPADRIQRNLFTAGDAPDAPKLMNLLDDINRIHGKNTVFFGAEGTTKPWAMKRNNMTPSYTTRWDALPQVM